MVFGEDPREGYFRGALFLHPGSRFQVTFPDGWTTANEKQSVSAAVFGSFTAATDAGTLSGDVVFVELGTSVFRLLAYSSAARWAAYREAADRSLQSFAPLTDPAALAAQPCVSISSR